MTTTIADHLLPGTLRPLDADRDLPKPRGPRRAMPGLVLSGLLATTFLAGIAGATLTETESVVYSRQAVVVAESENKRIQHLEGGVVREILVREGDRVEAGAVIARIAPEAAEGNLGERSAKAGVLRAREARLRAEADGAASVSMPPDVPAAVAAEEIRVFEEGLRKLKADVSALDASAEKARRQAASLRASGAQVREQESSMAELVARYRAAGGAASEGKTLQMQAELAQIRARANSLPEEIAGAEASEREALAKRDSVEAERRAFARGKLAEVLGELEGLRQGEAADTDRVARTDLRAPVAGIVRSLAVTAPGEVVAPGATVAELVPTGTGLVVAAKLTPEDTLAVAPGQRANIRLSRYAYATRDTAVGEVLSVAPDSDEDKRTGARMFTVKVRTAEEAVGGVKASPGMTATVAVVTGQRRIIEWFLDPVLHWLDTALRER